MQEEEEKERIEREGGIGRRTRGKRKKTSKRGALTIWAREDTDLDLAELVNEVQFGEAEQPGWRMVWFLNWQELEK